MDIEDLIKRLWRGRGRPSETRESPRSVADDETFVTLIQVAREDEHIRRTLRSLLGLDPFHRRSLLNQWLADLRRRRAPDDFIQALTCLLDDDVAAKALELIEDAD